MNWYSFDVSPGSDGEHLVRWGPWPRSGDKGQTLALAFYRNGKEIRRYSVADLVPDYKNLPFSTSHYQWQTGKSVDHVGKRVKVVLCMASYAYKAGKSVLFSMRSGEVIRWEVSGVNPRAHNHRESPSKQNMLHPAEGVRYCAWKVELIDWSDVIR